MPTQYYTKMHPSIDFLHRVHSYDHKTFQKFVGTHVQMNDRTNNSERHKTRPSFEGKGKLSLTGKQSIRLHFYDLSTTLLM